MSFGFAASQNFNKILHARILLSWRVVIIFLIDFYIHQFKYTLSFQFIRNTYCIHLHTHSFFQFSNKAVVSKLVSVFIKRGYLSYCRLPVKSSARPSDSYLWKSHHDVWCDNCICITVCNRAVAMWLADQAGQAGVLFLLYLFRHKDWHPDHQKHFSVWIWNVPVQRLQCGGLLYLHYWTELR